MLTRGWSQCTVSALGSVFLGPDCLGTWRGKEISPEVTEVAPSYLLRPIAGRRLLRSGGHVNTLRLVVIQLETGRESLSLCGFEGQSLWGLPEKGLPQREGGGRGL